MATFNNVTLSSNTDIVKLPNGTTGERPVSATNGMTRFNTTTKQFESYLNGSWVGLGAQNKGATPDNPATSASQILAENPNAGSGFYWIKGDQGGSKAYKVYCDMTTDGGGWMCLHQAQKNFVYADRQNLLYDSFGSSSYANTSGKNFNVPWSIFTNDYGYDLEVKMTIYGNSSFPTTAKRVGGIFRGICWGLSADTYWPSTGGSDSYYNYKPQCSGDGVTWQDCSGSGPNFAYWDWTITCAAQSGTHAYNDASSTTGGWIMHVVGGSKNTFGGVYGQLQGGSLLSASTDLTYAQVWIRKTDRAYGSLSNSDLGLRLFLDPSNPNSAPGGLNGRIWKNLSQHPYNMGDVDIQSLTSNWLFRRDAFDKPGPTFGTVWNGTTLNGSTAGMAINLNNYYKLKNTWIFWVYADTYSGTGHGLFINRDTTIANDNNWHWHGIWDNGNMWYSRIGSSSAGCCGNDASLSFTSYSGTGTWRMYAISSNFTDPAYTHQVYVNGTSVVTKSTTTDVSSSNVSTMGRLGAGHENTNASWLGHLGIIKCFDRQLTTTEINYEFTKYRKFYGI